MNSHPPWGAEPGTRTRRRWSQRIHVVLGLVLALLLAGATAASAHTRLIATSPAGSATLAISPRTVVLTFDSGILISSRTLSVISPDGTRADLPGTLRTVTGGHGVAVNLRPGLPGGSYGVTWRIASTDGHPASGTFSFGIRAPADLPPDRSLVAGSTTVGVLDAAVHVMAYLTLMLLLGETFFLAVIGPAGPATHRQRRLLWTAWAGSLAASLLAYPLDAADTFGLTLQSLFAPHLWRAEAELRPAFLVLARLLLLLLVLPIFTRLLRTGRIRGVGPAFDVLAAGAALLATMSLAGHAAAGDHPGASILLDLAHLCAGSIWLGGLAALSLGHLGQAPGHVMRRWSRAAAGAITTLVATGSYAAWREIGSYTAATTTAYGRWFLVKLTVVALVLGCASRARRLANSPASPGPHSTSLTPGLRRLVGIEILLGTTVLIVTGILTSTQPATTAFTSPATYAIDVRQNSTGASARIDATLSATTVGVTNINLDISSASGLTAGPASGLLTGPNGSTELFTLRPSGPATLTAYDLDIGTPGTWTMRLNWQNQSTAVSGDTTFRIR